MFYLIQLAERTNETNIQELDEIRQEYEKAVGLNNVRKGRSFPFFTYALYSFFPTVKPITDIS